MTCRWGFPSPMLRGKQIKHFSLQWVKPWSSQPTNSKCGSHSWACNCQTCLTLGYVRWSDLMTTPPDTEALMVSVACSVTQCLIFNNTCYTFQLSLSSLQRPLWSVLRSLLIWSFLKICPTKESGKRFCSISVTAFINTEECRRRGAAMISYHHPQLCTYF